MAVTGVARFDQVMAIDPASPETMVVQFGVTYVGSDVMSGRQDSQVSVTITGDDTAATVMAKLRDAVIAEAGNRGVTGITARDLVLPQYTKG